MPGADASAGQKGTDVIIAQAGRGHSETARGTMSLVPAVTDAVALTPVLAWVVSPTAVGAAAIKPGKCRSSILSELRVLYGPFDVPQ